MREWWLGGGETVRTITADWDPEDGVVLSCPICDHDIQMLLTRQGMKATYLDQNEYRDREKPVSWGV